MKERECEHDTKDTFTAFSCCDDELAHEEDIKQTSVPRAGPGPSLLRVQRHSLAVFCVEVGLSTGGGRVFRLRSTSCLKETMPMCELRLLLGC